MRTGIRFIVTSGDRQRLQAIVADLQAAINRLVREYNDANPKPFIWKADPDHIIAARNRGFQTLESIH